MGLVDILEISMMGPGDFSQFQSLQTVDGDGLRLQKVGLSAPSVCSREISRLDTRSNGIQYVYILPGTEADGSTCSIRIAHGKGHEQSSIGTYVWQAVGRLVSM